MLKDEVLKLAEAEGHAQGVDPYLILAVCEQESSYRHDVTRMEPGFEKRYTDPLSLATTTEILLACSYGLMQTMGLILKELGFFEFYRKFHNASVDPLHPLVDPLSEICVVKGLNAYMVRPQWQVQYGTMKLASCIKAKGGDVTAALLKWNGGGNKAYPGEVLARYDKLNPKGK